MEYQKDLDLPQMDFSRMSDFSTSMEAGHFLTRESILVAGMGIERAGAEEFREMADRINRNGADFDTAVESITPILSLLTSGLYIVTGRWMIRTDGMGHFFWDVPDAPPVIWQRQVSILAEIRTLDILVHMRETFIVNWDGLRRTD